VFVVRDIIGQAADLRQPHWRESHTNTRDAMSKPHRRRVKSEGKVKDAPKAPAKDTPEHRPLSA